MSNDYALLDSGDGRKLERFGDYTLIRPAAQAAWRPQHPATWQQAQAQFDRRGRSQCWSGRAALPPQWTVRIADIEFKLSSTDFGHLGVFPEQQQAWQWIRALVRRTCKRSPSPVRVLNLFAYSGGATLAAAQGGAEVCHLDAARGMVAWARENAALNGLEQAPIRWIVDDVPAFLKREHKRGRRYEGIILDPPSFGRGARGEVFKIQDHLGRVLAGCHALLSEHPLFLLLSCHTPEYSPIILGNLLRQTLAGQVGQISQGEMLLTGTSDVWPLPSGTFARWAAAPREEPA